MSLIDETLNKLIAEGLNSKLVQFGFKLYKKKTFRKKNQESMLELNVQLRKISGQNAGYVSVFPAIIYDEINSIASELEGVEPRKGWPVAAANVGNLKPEREFIEWPLTTTTDILALGEVIYCSIKDYALPFWEQFSTIEGLIDGYEKKDQRLTLTGNSFYWRMAAAYYLTGRHEEAINVLKKWEQGRPPQEVMEQAFLRITKMIKEKGKVE